MATLDNALEDLQEALDEQDLEAICLAAQVVLAVCGVLGRLPGGEQGGARVDAEDRDFEPFDPDELGLDPEEFDLKLWRNAAGRVNA